MLLIRSAQMDAFTHHSRNEFLAMVASSVEEHLPLIAATMPARLLARRLDWAVAAAGALGFVRRADLHGFAMLVIGIGPCIGEHDRVQEILADATIPTTGKIAHVLQSLSEADWLYICAQPAPDTWPMD